MATSVSTTRRDDRAGISTEGMSREDKILQEARDRFKRCQDWESDFRKLYVDDVKFANGDSDNGWQWPNDLKRDRDVNQRPSLTINKTAQHVLQITNDARQNKPSITVKPATEEVSYEAAQVFEGLIRYIERSSRAQAIYDDATESQVEGGIGYWRVITEYVSDESFDQEIRIAPVRDHLNVYLDPDIKQRDGSDAKFGFIFEELPEDEFKRQYPDLNLPVDSSTALDERDDWVRKDNVRIAEYYRIVEKDDTLIYMEEGIPTGMQQSGAQAQAPQSAQFLLSEAPPELRKDILASNPRKRSVKSRKLHWYKIAGNEIIDELELAGKYVPIIRLCGREKVIEGRLERKGHVRTLKDPQRMYNYNSSAQVEFGALATKVPWSAPAAAIAGNETAWFNSNRKNPAVLTWNHMDEEGNAIPEPKRPEPPGASPAFLQGMQIAMQEFEMASGQYPAKMGEPSNERSGRAIEQRQRQGDNATYHFIDNLGIAIQFTGTIILDLIPKIYDTKRVIQILGRDGVQTKVHLDPTSKEALQEIKHQQESQEEVKIIFNPGVGKYLVEADIGPAYATQRQEAWNAFVQIVGQNPQLVNLIGDLMFTAADFPLADKIAERIRRMIEATTPYILDPEAQNPQLAQLQNELNDKNTQIGELLQQLGEFQIKLGRQDIEGRARQVEVQARDLKRQGEDKKREIEIYDAQTRRMVGLGNTVKDMGQDVLKPAVRQILAEMLGFSLAPEAHAIQAGIDQEMHDAEVASMMPNEDQGEQQQ